MISMDLDLDGNADVLDSQGTVEGGQCAQAIETDLVVESMLEATNEMEDDAMSKSVDVCAISGKVDDDLWSLSDTDSVDAKLVWSEACGCEMNPGPNTLALHGQISVEGQYFSRGLLCELGSLQYFLDRVPTPRRQQGIVVLPRNPDVTISINKSDGGHLLVGEIQRVCLQLSTGRQSIPLSSTLQIEIPKEFSIQRVLSSSISPTSSDDDHTPTNTSVSLSKTDNVMVCLQLPAVGAERDLDIELQVTANREASSSSARCWEVNCVCGISLYTELISRLYSTLRLNQLSSSLPARNRQFLQAFISNTFLVELVLQSVKILCGNIKLQAMHSEMETEQTVIPAQTTGYLWVTREVLAGQQGCCAIKYKIESFKDEHEMKVNFHL
ncbi:uncharacterized protein LOC134186166 isoform X2 [Corticium candelabrum]|uniref:uncharacterized protein LOC134186166 isoform X2 n=1 Tax=Corticium candelabrum TaxID=121492 RepID=UPI002E27350C|nr:uncharacterized protein LOC134186166 isoform X2 [Corticium candelabrum]